MQARTAWLFSLFLWVILVSGCERHGLEQLSVQGRTMGTYYNVKVVAPGADLPDREALLRWSDELLERLNQSMSTYREDSEISQLNRSTTREWQPVSAPLVTVLALSQDISAKTQGAFDVTVAPLVNLWGFGPEQRPEKSPTAQALAQAMAKVGYRKVELRKQPPRLRKPTDVMLDFSAVAKGYAADELAQLITAKGYNNVMVEVGGELSLHGVSVRGTPWRIGIETPNYDIMAPSSAPTAAVELSGKGMATSGDYRNYYEMDGQRFSHTIDPKTGKPITHKLASVTVVADSCALADAWATALNVLGPEQGEQIARENGVAAYFIVKEAEGFATRYTPEFAQYLSE